jgi:hypothetical protein
VWGVLMYLSSHMNSFKFDDEQLTFIKGYLHTPVMHSLRKKQL